MRPICFICLIAFFSGNMYGQSTLKKRKKDLVQFTGRCQYIGFTGSIIFTTYYLFKIDKVTKGKYVGDSIIFRADHSGNLDFADQQIEENEVHIDVKEIFPFDDVPISKIYRCTCEPMEIELVKVVEVFKGVKYISYRRLGNKK